MTVLGRLSALLRRRRGVLGVHLTRGADEETPAGWTIRVAGTGNEADVGRSMWSVWEDEHGRLWFERFGYHVGVRVLIPEDAADSLVHGYLARRAREGLAS